MQLCEIIMFWKKYFWIVTKKGSKLWFLELSFFWLSCYSYSSSWWKTLTFKNNLRHIWVAPLFVRLVWSVSSFDAKGRIKNQRVLAIVPKKTPSSWIALVWWVSMIEEEESSFNLPLVLTKNPWFPAKKDPFNFMYGSFFILAQMTVKSQLHPE